MWIHIPSNISHFFQGSGCWIYPCPSLYQELSASVFVSGKVRQPRFWRLAWGKATWTKHLSTPTCEPSQADSIVAAWLESLEDSPAKTSVLPVAKQASPESAADCSSRSSDSFASWNPSSGCFSKTSRQFSLFQQDQPFSENLPKSGSMRSGELFERPTLARRIDGSGRLSSPIEGWPTPAAQDDNKSPEAYRKMRETKLGRTGKAAETISSLQVKVQTWPTPDANAMNDGETPESFEARRARNKAKHGNGNGMGTPLAMFSQTWPTPRGTDGTNGGPNQAGSRGDLMPPSAAAQWHTPRANECTEQAGTFVKRNADRGEHCFSGLTAQAAQWATPNARDDHNPSQPDSARSKRKLEQGWTIDLNEQAAWWTTPQAHDSSGGDPSRVGRFGTKHGGRNLADDVTAWNTESAWPTPASRDHKGANSESHMDRSTGAMHLDQLPNFVAHCFHPDQATTTHGAKSSPSGQTSRRRLSPIFVEWLLGLPIGWTDFASLEMESWRSRAVRRLSLWLNAQGYSRESFSTEVRNDR